MTPEDRRLAAATLAVNLYAREQSVPLESVIAAAGQFEDYLTGKEDG